MSKKPKNLLKCLSAAAILSQISMNPIASHAEVNSAKDSVSQENIARNGLVAYYFKDSSYKELSSIQVEKDSTLFKKQEIKTNQQPVQSIRLIGKIKPTQNGEYAFSISSNDANTIIQINGQTVLQEGKKNTPIHLEKNKNYDIKIEYRSKQEVNSNIQLFWSKDGEKKELIPQNQLLLPDFKAQEKVIDEQSHTLLLPKHTLFNSASDSGLADTDKDGIPDEWEATGYTFKDQQIVKWDDAFLTQGYKKYLSNPNKIRTVADPYTDFEKVIGYMPAATKDEARDPMVAAYPAVGVGMEKFFFSKNENVSDGTSGTISKSVTDTNSTTNGVDVSAELGWSKGWSLKGSLKYSHSWTNSTAIQDTESESWSKQIGINTAESAFLNANVRYYNAGTAPIYDLRPTTNFVFDKSGTSIATITAGSNQIGNSLAPSDTYPKREQAPISLDKANEAGTMKISINAEQLDALQQGTDTLSLETTQNKGQYGILDENGNLVTDTSKQWDPVRTNIDAVTGAITLDYGTGKDSLERRVAAKNENDPEDKTPEITIREAIKKAFDTTELDGRLYYTDAKGNKVCIDEPTINIVTDDNTKKQIEQQLEQMQDKKIYNAKWKRGMKITLHMPTAYYDFEKTAGTEWYSTYQENGGFSGKRHGRINTDGNGYAQKELQLKPYTSYTARAYVRTASTTGKNDVTLYVDDTINANGKGSRETFSVEGNEWKLIEFSFNTMSNPEYFKKLGIKNNGNANLHFDDVSVTEWGQGENIEQAHKFEKWDASSDGSGKIGSVTFSKVPAQDIRYQVQRTNEKGEWVWDNIVDAPPVDANGKRTLNITGTHGVRVFAVNKDTDNLKVKLAEYIPFSEDHKDSQWILEPIIQNTRGVSGMQFNNVMRRNVNYKLVLDGRDYGTKSGAEIDNEGNRFLNLKEYNGGNLFPVGLINNQVFNIFAIDADNPNIFEKIKIGDFRTLVLADHKNAQGPYDIYSDSAEVSSMPDHNDTITTIVLPPKSTITIYQDKNYGGKSKTYVNDNSQVPMHIDFSKQDEWWNDTISSFKYTKNSL
ncbi:binary toxin-like calcium binding domain-containing protein [Bacillus cereus]|uniref:binary toxin-like calcium binding domain-containing protein n=1 Tax=Bacillus cereus TaxID=1396 RepID=UPI000BF58B6B|nr:binary toxin-like calcium binding domain-containing protein [Bacillus cereus]PFN17570.1 Iota toxin protein Ib [Bacillus cereus]